MNSWGDQREHGPQQTVGRDAYVYVRQSTLTQVREHTESLGRQDEWRLRPGGLLGS